MAPPLSNGIPIGVTPEETASSGYPSALTNNLDLSPLSPGLHQLGVRTVDNSGRVSATNWLPVQIYDFGVLPTPVPISAINDSSALLVYAEYFWDARPAPSNGIPVRVTADETFAAGYPSALTNMVDLSSLTPGPHQLGFRTMDNQGRVSTTSWLPVQVYDPTNVTAATGNVTVNDSGSWLEYTEAFWDVAPPLSNGIPIGVTPEETASSGYPSALTNHLDLSPLILVCTN